MAFKNHIQQAAKYIVHRIGEPSQTGIFNPTINILRDVTEEHRFLVINELKKLDVEFKNNNEYYRY